MIERREVGALIVRHADRAGRNDTDNSALRIATTLAQVVWHQINGPTLDPSNSGGALFLKQTQGWAEFESAVKSERLRSVYAQLRRDGRLRATTKTFGWRWAKGDPQRAMLADPIERAAIQDAYQRLFDGETLYSIIQHWNADSLINPVRKAKFWSYASVRAALLRPSNAGFIRDGDGWLPDVRGKWEPLTDEATYLRVRALLTNPARRTNPGRNSAYLGSGIVTCGVCGGVLRSSTVAGRGAGGKRVPIYRCTSKLAFVADPDVRHVSARIEELDPKIRAAVVAAFAFGPADLFPDAAPNETSRFYEELRSIVERRQELLSGVGEGLYKLADIRADLAALKESEEALRARLEQATASEAGRSMLSDLRAGLLTPGRMDVEAFNAYKEELGRRFDALDIQRRRELVRNLLDVTVLRLAPGRVGVQRWRIVQRVVSSLNEDVPGLVN